MDLTQGTAKQKNDTPAATKNGRGEAAGKAILKDLVPLLT